MTTTDKPILEGWPTLQEVLNDTFMKNLLRCYLIDEKSAENLEFLESVELYESQFEKMSPKLRGNALKFIKEQFLDRNADRQVNLSYQIQQTILKKFGEVKGEAPKDVFTEAKQATQFLLYTEQYTYFINQLNSNIIGTGKKDVYSLYLSQFPPTKAQPLYSPVLAKIMEGERNAWTVDAGIHNVSSKKNLLDDLIRDETKYVGDLTFLCNFSKDLLTKRSLNAETNLEIFEYLPTLLQHHQKFLNMLEEFKPSIDSKSIGELLNTGLHFLILYRYYLRHVPKNICKISSLTLTDEMESSAEKQILLYIENKDRQLRDTEKAGVYQLMLLPFFRPQTYLTFIEEFSKLAKKDSQDMKELDACKSQMKIFIRLMATYTKADKIQRMFETLKIFIPFTFTSLVKLYERTNELSAIASLDRFDTTELNQLSISHNAKRKVTLLITNRGLCVTDAQVIKKKVTQKNVINKTFISMTLFSEIRDFGSDPVNTTIWIDVPETKKRIWFGCEVVEQFRLCVDVLNNLLSN
ncbi:Regulator of g protein signaling domain containing protein [Entamoeba marina]